MDALAGVGGGGPEGVCGTMGRADEVEVEVAPKVKLAPCCDVEDGDVTPLGEEGLPRVKLLHPPFTLPTPPATKERNTQEMFINAHRNLQMH